MVNAQTLQSFGTYAVPMLTAGGITYAGARYVFSLSNNTAIILGLALAGVAGYIAYASQSK